MKTSTLSFPGLLLTAAAASLTLGGCGIMETSSEKKAKDDLASVEARFRPVGVMPELPVLKEGSPFEDYLSFAVLNSPEVEAAYYEWASSVSEITVARSLPDPRITYQMDIQRGFVPSIMPGIAFDVPGPGKLTAAADKAAASSEIKYRLFAQKALETAYNLEKVCWDLRFVDAKLKALRSSLALLNEIEAQARAANATGRASLQDVLRAQIEEEKLRTEIKNLEDGRKPLVEKFKAALGLKPGQVAPPEPSVVPSFPDSPELPEKILDEALAKNQNLKAVEAEIKLAGAELVVADKAKIPDFSGGVEVDARAIPVLIRPNASMTLPIWRDKIAAGIAAAQASKSSAEAKLGAAQIALAVACAEKSYLAKEAVRNLETLKERLIPKARQALEAARAAYSSGGVDFLTLLEAERTLLNFDVEEAAASLQRDSSVAELALTLAGRIPPEIQYLQKSDGK